MLRTVTDVDDFAGAPGDPDGYRDQVAGLWESGQSKPEWCFRLDDGSGLVARIGYRVAPPVTDPGWIGDLPELELFAFGLHAPWSGDFLAPGRAVVRRSLAAVGADLPDLLEIRINNEVHPHAESRCRLLEACGMELFHEKQGFYWVDDGTPVEVPDRLTFTTYREAGRDTYAAVMGPCIAGTLDRNDRYYWEGCGPDNWAQQMTAFVAQDDEDMWLLAYRDGSPVGYVAVSAVDDWGSTIAHVGVRPEHRGKGYINDLLAAGTAAAQRKGISTMLSDVDVLNTPMIEAMLRAGHGDDRRPWHVWVYRASVADITES